MRLRMAIAGMALIGILASGGASVPSAGASSGSGSTFCTWGGTPAAPTGYVTLTPGIRQFVPASEPLKLYVSGELAGGAGCEGKMVFKGVAEAGATCGEVIFDGKVYGVPGVDHFYGPGIGGVVYENLYDREGRIVGADQPLVLSPSAVQDCQTPEGFTHGAFSSTVEFYGTPLDPNELQP
jgi:hypothetical protein